MNIHGLILAAGLSSRMGAFKPLMRIRGQSLLALSVESLLTGGATEITVVLGYRARDGSIGAGRAVSARASASRL